MKVKSTFELFDYTFFPHPFVSQIISGHLTIEFLLNKLLVISDPTTNWKKKKLRHAQLIELNHQKKHLTDAQAKILFKINQMRNKFAHDIAYTPSISELKTLFEDSSEAFSDITDGIYDGLNELREAKKISDLSEFFFPELFVQISYDLHEIYQEYGGSLDTF